MTATNVSCASSSATAASATLRRKNCQTGVRYRWNSTSAAPADPRRISSISCSSLVTYAVRQKGSVAARRKVPGRQPPASCGTPAVVLRFAEQTGLRMVEQDLRLVRLLTRHFNDLQGLRLVLIAAAQ